MSSGYKIIQKFKRPPLTLIEAFRKLPVPNIGDSMNRTVAISADIKPINHTRLLGCAYTVRVPAGDNLLFYYSIDQASPGDVIVVDGGGFKERALCGEIMATLAMKRGIAGFVIDGAIRDIVELSEMNFPVFARSSSPNGPYKNGPGEVNVPVSIGGRIIYPGDIIVGDGNGVISIAQEEAEEVLQKAEQILQKETALLQEIDKNNQIDLNWLYEKLKYSGVSI